MKLLWEMYEVIMLLLTKMDWFGMGGVVMVSAWRRFVASRGRNVMVDERRLRIRWPWLLM